MLDGIPEPVAQIKKRLGRNSLPLKKNPSHLRRLFREAGVTKTAFSLGTEPNCTLAQELLMVSLNTTATKMP